jgi:transcriptional regulator with XRE-family HTH domain
MPDAPQPPDQGPWTLADRINALFDTFYAPGERPPTIDMVVREIQARGGEMSIGYLSQLRTGKSANPRLAHLRALADYFGVPLSYFTDDAESRQIAEEMRLLRALRDNDVRALALRASYMDDETRAALTAVINKLAPPLPTD